MRRANYKIVGEDEDVILLDDMGPWDQFLSITNAAEQVVAELAPKLRGRHLIYYDTDGELTELEYKGAEFTGFKVASEDIIRGLSK